MSKIINLSEKNSLIHQFVLELRDIEIQKDSMRFRRNLERIGEICAYEISKTLRYKTIEVTTPLGVANVPVIDEEIVLVTILRAGLPLHQGLLNYFDGAENGFVSAYRKHHKDGTFEIELEYLACPSIEGKTLILSDPMLATGSSMVNTYKSLLEKGTPSKIHIATAISSTEGINYTERSLPENTTIWSAAVDEELTAQSYIVPGLGDAGDLAFGKK